MLFLHYTLYIINFSPFNIVGTLLMSLWNSTKAQGALLDLHGHQNGSGEAKSRGPSIKKCPPRSCKIGEYTLRVACVKSGFEAGAKHVDTQIVFFINREKVTCYFYNTTLIILVNGHVHLKQDQGRK